MSLPLLPAFLLNALFRRAHESCSRWISVVMRVHPASPGAERTSMRVAATLPSGSVTTPSPFDLSARSQPSQLPHSSTLRALVIPVSAERVSLHHGSFIPSRHSAISSPHSWSSARTACRSWQICSSHVNSWRSASFAVRVQLTARSTSTSSSPSNRLLMSGAPPDRLFYVWLTTGHVWLTTRSASVKALTPLPLSATMGTGGLSTCRV